MVFADSVTIDINQLQHKSAGLIRTSDGVEFITVKSCLKP